MIYIYTYTYVFISYIHLFDHRFDVVKLVTNIFCWIFSGAGTHQQQRVYVVCRSLRRYFWTDNIEKHIEKKDSKFNGSQYRGGSFILTFTLYLCNHCSGCLLGVWKEIEINKSKTVFYIIAFLWSRFFTTAAIQMMTMTAKYKTFI